MTLVVNTQAQAVWEYSTAFNSYCVINDVVYGANADGLFVIDSGDTDDGVEIDASWSFGNLPLAPTEARVSAAYVNAKAGGDLVVGLSADGGDTLEYTVSPTLDGRSHSYRTVTAKGARGKYWQLKINNVGGCDFAVDDISLDVAPSARRV